MTKRASAASERPERSEAAKRRASDGAGESEGRSPSDKIDALFINSGILGQRTFAEFVRRAFADEIDGVRVTQTVVTDGLTPAERAMRYALCLRVWPPGTAGIRNLDFHRYRCELNAGLLARNRLRR